MREMDSAGEARSLGVAAHWLTSNADLLPSTGRALDIACGDGRNALFLARHGLHVDALDIDNEKIRSLGERASAARLPIAARVFDLEAEGVDLGSDVYDVIAVFHYLHRPLFSALMRALRHRGVLLYETFTVEQARRGRPKNPRFLLARGELPRLVAPLEILREREGDYENRMVAGIAARKTVAGPECSLKPVSGT